MGPRPQRDRSVDALAWELAVAIKTRRTQFRVSAVSRTELGRLLSEVESQGLARRRGEYFELLKGGRVALVVASMRMGVPVVRLAEHMSPGEFEDLVSRLLEMRSYDVRTRVRVRTQLGATEFDIIGLRMSKALFIDCKRWPRRSVSSMACRTHVKRIRKWGPAALRKVRAGKGAIDAFPAVATALAGVERVTDGCLLLGVDKLNSAIEKMEQGFLDDISIRIGVI